MRPSKWRKAQTKILNCIEKGSSQYNRLRMKRKMWKMSLRRFAVPSPRNIFLSLHVGRARGNMVHVMRVFMTGCLLCNQSNVAIWHPPTPTWNKGHSQWPTFNTALLTWAGPTLAWPCDVGCVCLQCIYRFGECVDGQNVAQPTSSPVRDLKECHKLVSRVIISEDFVPHNPYTRVFDCIIERGPAVKGAPLKSGLWT